MRTFLASAWRFAERLSLFVSLFNDIPPLIVWLYDWLPAVLAIAANEPVGATALLLSLAIGVTLAWVIMRKKPPVL